MAARDFQIAIQTLRHSVAELSVSLLRRKLHERGVLADPIGGMLITKGPDRSDLALQGKILAPSLNLEGGAVRLRLMRAPPTAPCSLRTEWWSRWLKLCWRPFRDEDSPASSVKAGSLVTATI